VVRVDRICAGVFLAGALVAAPGCGSSSSPPALIGPFAIADSAYNAEDASGFAFHGITTIVESADFAGVCDHVTQRQGVPNSKVLALALGAVDTGGNASPVSAPGRYLIVTDSAQAVDGLYAQAFFQHVDGTCNPDVELGAIAGDVTITRIDGSGLEGDLHLTAFENSVTTAQNPVPQRTGDQVSTHFVAIPCPTLTLNSTPQCP
jgi:hypothetical protein